MQTQTQETQRFVEEWMAEFARAIETLTGDAPAMNFTPRAGTGREPATLDQYLWWKQNFEAQAPAVAWVGALEAAWSALGSEPGSGKGAARDVYLKMLSQSLQGAARIPSGGLPKSVSWGAGQVESPPSLASMEIREVGITLKGSPLPPLIVAIEPAFATAANAGDPVAETLRSLDSHTTPTADRDLGRMLDRLIDLELPMSIALGRAVLPIRDVLKLTAGSLVELDRHVGDTVEVLVHGTLVAKGEVVSVKGNYGIRIQEIISHGDRLALQRKAKPTGVSASAD
jgi:flagellar motor switch protein FliN